MRACTERLVEHIVDARPGIHQPAADEIDALALEPAGIRSREALFGPLRDLARNVAGHHLAQEQLAIARLREVALALTAWFVFVEAHGLGEVAELGTRRQPHGEIGEVVVEERHTRLQPVRHRQLILDDQQAVEEGLGLEIEASD